MGERERLQDATFFQQSSQWTAALRELLAAVEREDHPVVLAVIARGIRAQERELLHTITERRRSRGLDGGVL